MEISNVRKADAVALLDGREQAPRTLKECLCGSFADENVLPVKTDSIDTSPRTASKVR